MIDWLISLSGKGGQKIREIQSESGAYIKVCKKVVTVERMIGYKLKVSCDILLFSLSKFSLYIHAKHKKNLMMSEKSLKAFDFLQRPAMSPLNHTLPSNKQCVVLS